MELLGKLQGQIQANQINITAQANAQAAAGNRWGQSEPRDFDPTEFHDILMRVALRQLAERAYNRGEEDWHKWMEIDLGEDGLDEERDLPAS